ncbi:MAG TPA: DUF488 domain-containing protein [Asticcacaulis sp.]|nr:DUF488 domain-containing protein [Asticcacaulis sp.]
MSEVVVKRIYAEPDPADGTRVLVDRVWPRGIKKTRAALDLWLKDIAPSTELRKWFGHDPARWEAFQTRYRAELDAMPDVVARLRELTQRGKVTLLFAAHDDVHNNAVVLAHYLR